MRISIDNFATVHVRSSLKWFQPMNTCIPGFTVLAHKKIDQSHTKHEIHEIF